VIASFLSLIVLFLLFDLVVMRIYTRQGSQRFVPNLILLSEQQAKVAADSAGFELIVSNRKVSTRVPEGTILEQHPFAGTLAKPGRKIRVIPALAAAPDVAPELVGLDLRDAQLRCKNIGLVCGPTEIRYRFTSRTPKGSVIEQDPTAGKPVQSGSAVRVVVSMGPEPAHFYVPTIVDQTLHDVRTLLREAGLKLGKIDRRESDEHPAGTVIEQSIPPGEDVESGMAIDVVVAVRPRVEEPAKTDEKSEPN